MGYNWEAHHAKRVTEMNAEIRDELSSHIAEIKGDIEIAIHLGNLSIAASLKNSLLIAEKDLANYWSTK